MAGRRTCVINLLFLYHYQLIFILFCSIWRAYVFVLIMYSLHMHIQYNMSAVIALESRQYNGIYNNKYERHEKKIAATPQQQNRSEKRTDMINRKEAKKIA